MKQFSTKKQFKKSVYQLHSAFTLRVEFNDGNKRSEQSCFEEMASMSNGYVNHEEVYNRLLDLPNSPTWKGNIRKLDLYENFFDTKIFSMTGSVPGPQRKITFTDWSPRGLTHRIIETIDGRSVPVERVAERVRALWDYMQKLKDK